MTANGPLTLAALALALAAPLLSLCGCQQADREVTFTTADGSRCYFEHFNNACMATDRRGECDIVLSNDPTSAAAAGSTSLAISPTPVEPLRQLIHLHIFWQVPPSNVVRDASVTNASVVWCLANDTPGRPPSVLTYDGAGFVRVDMHDHYALVTITDGRVRLSSAKGNVRDPMGPAVLSGTFEATTNPGRVREILQRMDDLSANARQ